MQELIRRRYILSSFTGLHFWVGGLSTVFVNIY
uniref:Uncharacterized protein n=1 Tax=Anguilla anguilla TaxID=7936 RepID=A0A0E9SZJ6_ANGAN